MPLPADGEARWARTNYWVSKACFQLAIILWVHTLELPRIICYLAQYCSGPILRKLSKSTPPYLSFFRTTPFRESKLSYRTFRCLMSQWNKCCTVLKIYVEERNWPPYLTCRWLSISVLSNRHSPTYKSIRDYLYSFTVLKIYVEHIQTKAQKNSAK